MSEHRGRSEGLFARIAAEPSDLEAYEVLADALVSSGDPRGELIAVHREMLRFPRHSIPRKLKRAEADLLGEHADALLGPLARWVKPVRSTGEVRIGPHFIGDLNPLSGPIAVDWRLGFIESISFGVDRAWWRERDAESALLALESLESARFLTGLAIAGMSYGNDDEHGPGTYDYQPFLDALARVRLPRLERLFIGDAGYKPEDASVVFWCHVGDPTDCLIQHSRITCLALSGGNMKLDALSMPGLRELLLRSPGLEDSTIRALPSFAPSIEVLEIDLGPDQRDFDREQLFEAFPNLRP